MHVPSDITIEHRLDKQTLKNRFFVSIAGQAPASFASFPSIKTLCEFIDRHDYRYVWGSFGKWRLA